MSTINLMFVADICGQAGRQAASYMIKDMRDKHSIDYVIANVENAAGGFGVTPEMSQKMFSYGIDMQTSGNHIWDRHEIQQYLKRGAKLLRPGNFPLGAPGRGSFVDTFDDKKIGVINVMGRTYMKDIDCPFHYLHREVEIMRSETRVIFVDFHAEATSEKQAAAFYLDGKISALIGTHTHVQTADEQISPNGTAYLTDAGMTGPHDSIIGMQKQPSLDRFLTGLPHRFSPASEDIKMSGVILQIDYLSGKTEKIERFRHDFDPAEYANRSGRSEVGSEE